MYKKLLFFFSVSLISCNKTIEVKNIEILPIENAKINTLEITDFYVRNYYYFIATRDNTRKYSSNKSSEGVIYKPLTPTQKITVIDNYGRISQIDEDKVLTVSQQRAKNKEEDEIMTKMRSRSEELDEWTKNKQDSLKIIYSKIKKNGISSKLTLKNNTNQNIEYAKIMTLISYQYPNQVIYYSFPKEIVKRKNNLKNEENIEIEIWKKNDKIEIEIPNIFDYAIDYQKFKNILNIHEPESVHIDFYISYSNSVGLKNFKKEFKYESFDVPNRSIALSYGAYQNFAFSPNEKKMFGELIYSQDISDVIKKNK